MSSNNSKQVKETAASQPPTQTDPSTISKSPKNMSQQEKLAFKDATKKSTTSYGSSNPTTTADQKSIEQLKNKAQYLRASTPPGQTGSRSSDHDGASPSSQACTSGTVTPNSEGVRRSDREPHAPPGGLDLG